MKITTLVQNGGVTMLSVIETERRTEQIMNGMTRQVNNKTRLWRPRTWVVTKDGRIGLVSKSNRRGRRWRTLVQLGADGQFHWFTASGLRAATREEVEQHFGAGARLGAPV